jgi:ZIP family zinc transporter
VIGFFLVGVLGLQIVSELLHRCLPSSIVSCEDHGGKDRQHDNSENGASAAPSAKLSTPQYGDDETTPLLERRPSLKYARSLLAKTCASGKCYGYSDHPCDQFCSIERNKKSSGSIKTACSSTEIRTHPLHDGHVHHHGYTRHDPQHSSHNHDHDHIPGDVEDVHGAETGHHHHVPRNKFLTIGIQTSIAIALHKFPEVGGLKIMLRGLH